MSNIERRVIKLETAQRTTYAGLVGLVNRGKVTTADLTDQELEIIVAPRPGEIDVRQLSDAELEAIVKGDATA